MNNIHTFRNYLQSNVKSNILINLYNIQGIRSTYPSRALIYNSENPQFNKEILAIYLKNEIISKINGAKSN